MRRLAPGLVVVAALGAAPSHAAVPGTIDGSYGTCGVLRAPGPAANAPPAGALRLPGGGGIAVGTASSALVTVKVRPDGQIDTSYGNVGTTTTTTLGGFERPNYGFSAVAAQSGGRIVVAGQGGERNDPGRAQAALARLNADGSLDASFGSGGVVLNALQGGTRSSLHDVDVDAAGRILVAGERDDGFALARFTPDGAPDSGWGSGGVAQFTFPGTKRGSAAAIRALPDGSALAGGQADEQFALARLKPDGTLDPGFGSGGVTLDSPPAAAGITAIEPLADGRIVVGGRAADINGEELAVARFTADGRPDTSFARAGFALTRDVRRANEILVQDDGGLLVTGDGFARFTPAGAPDPAFGAGGVFGTINVGDVLLGQDGSALGVIFFRTGMGFQRHALSGPALAALAPQPAICGVRITTRRVRELVSDDDSPYGSLGAGFDTLEPTITRWSATVRVGGRDVRLRAVRDRWDQAVPDEEVIIPLTRSQRARIARARSAHVTLTGRDSAGRAVTAERDLKR